MTGHANATRNVCVGPIVVRGQRVFRAAGYSRPELERLGLTARDAARLGIPLDRTRLTLLGCNLVELQALAMQRQLGGPR
jgi:ribosomal protein L13E